MPPYLRAKNLERTVLAVACAAIFLAWVLISILDINHPPGVRTARLAGVAIAFAIGALEAVRPWFGFYAFLLLWPQMWILRDVLQHHVSEIFGALPMITAGPMAAALAVGFSLHREPVSTPLNESVPNLADSWGIKSVRWMRAGLWCLAAVWTLSALVATLSLLKEVPPRWHTDPPDWRHLSALSPFSVLAPAASALRVLPELLLGLLLLDDLARNNSSRCLPLNTLLRVAGISAFIIGLEFMVQLPDASAGGSLHSLLQKIPGRSWSFDENPHSGPFNNRNTLAPVLLIFAILAFAAGQRNPERSRTWYAIATGLLLLTCFANSRNALFMLAVLGVVALFNWARASKKIWIIPTLLALGAAAVLWLPLPDSASLTSTRLKRVVETLEHMRAGDWESVTSYRVDLYSAAWNIFKLHPVLGSGPSTFPMLAGPGSMFLLERGGGYYSAHSMPLNLLAEMGVAGMGSWLAVWLIVPAVALVRTVRKSFLWLAVFAIGIGNLFDTVWLTPGMTTMSVLIIWWACWESANDSTTSRIPDASKTCASAPEATGIPNSPA